VRKIAHLSPIRSDRFGDVLEAVGLDEADEFGIDVVGEGRTLVNEAGVNLHQRGSGTDPSIRLCSAVDPSGTDQERAIVQLFGNSTEEFEGFLSQGCSADAADRLGVFDERVIYSRIGRNDPRSSGFDGGGAQGDGLFWLHVRSDLEEDGSIGDGLADAEHLSDEIFILQITQAGGVGGRDVDDDVGAIVFEGTKECLIVSECFVFRGGFVFADVDADGVVEKSKFFQALDHVPGALVVKSHGVLDSVFVDMAEEAGFGVARLGFWGNGADLGEAKSECGHRSDVVTVLVKSRCQTDRVGKRPAKNLLTQCGVIDIEFVGYESLACADTSDGTHGESAECVGGLGIEFEKEFFE